MSVNKVILVGHVGRDPEVRYLDNNRVVANFSLATNEVYRDRNGNRQESTEWHTIEMWDDLAKIAEKYVQKGKLLYLEGRIRTDSWIDKETKQERNNKVIRVNVMNFLGSAPSGGPQSRDTANPGNQRRNDPSDYKESSSNDADDLPF